MDHSFTENGDLPPLEEILAGIEPGRQLRIDLTTFWVPADRPGLRLSTVDPGAPRLKSRVLCPTIVADEGQTHADLLELVAGALRLAAGQDAPEPEAAPATLTAQRIEALSLIGSLWRGDWSGHVFDGRDGQRWIDTATTGTADELGELLAELRRVQSDMYGEN